MCIRAASIWGVGEEKPVHGGASRLALLAGTALALVVAASPAAAQTATQEPTAIGTTNIDGFDFDVGQDRIVHVTHAGSPTGWAWTCS